MAAFESRIDELYKLPLSEFVPARNALAKILTGDEAKTVRALAKPTVIPWSANQLCWHRRDMYTRLMQAGKQLRDAQIAALEGKTGDVRRAARLHEQSVAAAVKAATALANTAGLRADADALARTFEQLSLQLTPPEPPGRLTKPPQPQGFGALAGVVVKANPHVPGRLARSPAGSFPVAAPRPTPSELRERARRQREADEAARRQTTARTMLSRARFAEAKARTAWERAKQALANAEQVLAEIENRRDE